MFSSQIYSSWKEVQEEKYKSLLNFRHIFNGLVLEIGSGSGYLSDFLVANGINASMICVDIEKPSDVLADGAELPFKDTIFDTIISIDAMHLIDDNDFARVLKKGGFALLALFFNTENFNERRNLIKQKLHGFEIIAEFELCDREHEYVILGKKE